MSIIFDLENRKIVPICADPEKIVSIFADKANMEIYGVRHTQFQDSDAHNNKTCRGLNCHTTSHTT